jgi:flagellar basal body-associated protein FliL
MMFFLKGSKEKKPPTKRKKVRPPMLLFLSDLFIFNLISNNEKIYIAFSHRISHKSIY